MLGERGDYWRNASVAVIGYHEYQNGHFLLMQEIDSKTGELTDGLISPQMLSHDYSDKIIETMDKSGKPAVFDAPVIREFVVDEWSGDYRAVNNVRNVMFEDMTNLRPSKKNLSIKDFGVVGPKHATFDLHPESRNALYEAYLTNSIVDGTETLNNTYLENDGKLDDLILFGKNEANLTVVQFIPDAKMREPKVMIADALNLTPELHQKFVDTYNRYSSDVTPNLKQINGLALDGREIDRTNAAVEDNNVVARQFSTLTNKIVDAKGYPIPTRVRLFENAKVNYAKTAERIAEKPKNPDLGLFAIDEFEL